MNFLDTYDITGTTTPPPNQPEQSLNEEVTQVIGQLGRFWGGFRKQSQTALEIARKDFSEVVTQAQKELSKLTVTEPSSTADRGDPSTSHSDRPDPQTSSEAESTPSPSTPTNATESPASSSSNTQTLFSRLQSAMPPNIVATVQNNLPETLKHASENIDLAQLRTTLFSELQRVQGVTRTQAEEYVHKSEVLLREAMKEAGEVLRDAVKVIPPEEAGSSRASPGLVWDGTDMWMLPSEPSDSSLSASKTTDPGSSSRQDDSQRAVATRAESLLRRLKHDPAILRHDPEADLGVRDIYYKWLDVEIESKTGGIGGEEWVAKISAVSSEPGDGQALKNTRDALVPSELTMPVFWKRFFFRVHQIEQEEQKRKALIRGSNESDDDFTWEDDEDEPVATRPVTASQVTTPSIAPPSLSQTDNLAQPTTRKSEDPGMDREQTSLSPPTHTSATASPRESSEDGFDVVSSGNVSVVGDGKASDKGDTDEADSDWE